MGESLLKIHRKDAKDAENFLPRIHADQCRSRSSPIICAFRSNFVEPRPVGLRKKGRGEGTPMKPTLLAAILLLTTIAVAESVRSEKPLQNHGRVEMRLSGGDYEVRAGATDKIVVTATSDGESSNKKVRADVTVLGGAIAKIQTDGPHSNFHVVIEIPPETNLYIRLTAGDLRVKGITGNKDIESHAGDLNIDAGDPDSYREVDASVGAGDLNAPTFGVSKGGLFRSFRQTRKGHLKLHAHLGAGDLNLN
jgi:hypothetical protein